MWFARYPGLLLLLLCLNAPGEEGERPARDPEVRAQDATESLTRRRLEFAFTDRVGFEKKPPARPGDWLATFPEKGRSFKDYVLDHPRRADPGEFLAFMPIGPFEKDARAVFDRTVEFAKVWFDLETKVLPDCPLPEGGPTRKHFGRPQYQTTYFLRSLLPRRRPDAAVCLFGVTMADLYPGPSWNFVFGEATIRGGVSIWSFCRFFARFRGAEETDATRLKALRRACRLVAHEAGHTFGMLHCVKDVCVMNGSNSLEESDRYPLHLCPECLKKLRWNRGFDVLERYDALAAFCAKHGLKSEAKWFRDRAARIRTVK
jgi:archaemetzincin